MKKENIHHLLSRLICLPLLVVALTGCIKSDLNDCPDIMSIKVVLEATATGDSDIPTTPADISQLNIYVFDADGTYLGVHPAQIDQYIELDYPNAGKLQLVAMANVNPVNVAVTSFLSGNKLTAGSISLLKNKIVNNVQTYFAPSDIFWGIITIDTTPTTRGGAVIKHILPIKRIVASVNVKVRGLHLKTGATSDDNDFSVMVGTNRNAVTFGGTTIPLNPVVYAPTGTFTGNDTYEVPAFNILSSALDEPVTIYIYHGNTLIDTVTTYIDPAPGGLLSVRNGRQLEVRILYTEADNGELKITILFPGWNVVTLWPVDFN